MASLRTLSVVGVLFCGAALASCARSEEAAEPPPKVHTVIMEGMAFRPNVINVMSGDTIVWINKDMVPHSATSAGAGFDSKVIAANASWRTRVEQTGDFDYICSFHPMMTAKLQVR